MTVKKEPEKVLGFDPDKCSELYTELVDVFQKHKPTVGEILIAIGNLTYALGASIQGYKEGEGPSIENVERLYYEHPDRVGNALMMQGLSVVTWYESWAKTQIDKDKEASD